MTQQERDSAFQQAEAARVAGNYEAAQPIYERILADAPDFAPAHAGFCHCLLNTGFFDESLEAFRTAVDLTPNDVRALLTYGKALCMLGMYDDAKAQFERVLEIDPDNDDASEQMLYFTD